MSLQSYYEDSFRSERARSPQELLDEVLMTSKGLFNYVIECKNRFLPDLAWQGMRVLELGSGRGGLSLHLAKLGADITLVDFSSSALEQAERLFEHSGLKVKTVLADVTHPDVNLGHKYDLIVDSHLLHCIVSDPDRISFYQLIRDHLTEKGIFVCETMVHRKKLYVPDGFMFDQKNTLWQMFGDWVAIRRILDSLDLEEEIKKSGLEIVYFYYYGQYAFVPHKSFMDIPAEILPAAVRMVTKRA